MTDDLVCPHCGSDNVVKVWDDSKYDDRLGVSLPAEPDYLGCNDCDGDMVRLKDV